MPDYGVRLGDENERRLETASCRDLPQNNYGAQMLERERPSQHQPPQQEEQHHHHQSGARKLTGGIMRLANYRGWTVNVRAPKWKDNQLWINSEDLQAARFIADAAYHFTGRPPFHFPDPKFHYLPLRLCTGEELTTRKKCSAYVAKIAKGPALAGQRRDFKERAQKLILEMVKTPEVVQFLDTMRAWQPLPEATSEDPEGENGTPMEVDSLSVEAIQAIAPTGTVDFASVFQFPSTITNFPVDVELSTAFIPGFDMDLYESENFLAGACESLGIWHPQLREKTGADLVPENCKELLGLLEKGEKEIWESLEPLDLEPWRPLPTFGPYSPLLDPDGRLEAESRMQPTKLCGPLSGPFCVRTEGGPETFRGRFDAL